MEFDRDRAEEYIRDHRDALLEMPIGERIMSTLCYLVDSPLDGTLEDELVKAFKAPEMRAYVHMLLVMNDAVPCLDWPAANTN